MIRQTRLPFITLLILALSAFPQLVLGKPVDPSEVERLLSLENGQAQPEDKKAFIAKQVDKQARLETLQLAKGNQSWGEFNPKWKPVYERVHSDLAVALPQMNAAAESRRKNYDADIASHLQQSDIDAINAYYKSPEGKLYLDFSKRINSIFNSATALLLINAINGTKAHAPSETAKPTEEQTKNYMRMLKFSHGFQMGSGAVNKDGTAYGAMLAMTANVINSKQPELQELYNQYSNNLSHFEAFRHTDAATHLGDAMNAANMNMKKNSGAMADSYKELAKDRTEWKKLYQDATVN